MIEILFALHFAMALALPFYFIFLASR